MMNPAILNPAGTVGPVYQLTIPAKIRARSALLPILTALLAMHAEGAAVEFGFSGVITRAVGFPAVLTGVAEGMPFAGTLMYDPSIEGVIDTDKRPEIGGYYFHFEGSFQLTAQFGGHTVRTYTFRAGSAYAGISIYDNFNNIDEMSIGSSSSALLLDGAPYPEDASGSMSINFSDRSHATFSSDSLPTTIPDLSKFANRAAFSFRYAPAGGVDQWLEGTITSITPEPQYLLFARRNGNDLVLSWPLTATGFVVESRDAATPGSWQPEATAVVDTAAEHTVKVPMAVASSRLFRLRR